MPWTLFITGVIIFQSHNLFFFSLQNFWLPQVKNTQEMVNGKNNSDFLLGI